jgi:lipopolysaccharide export system protein LptA
LGSAESAALGTMAITLDARHARGLESAGEKGASVTDRERAFAAARRHSRLVRALRVLLPLTTVGMLAAYALVLTVSWQLSTSRLKVAGIQLSADDLKMKDPEYFGVTKEGGRYRVQAKTAEVSLNQNAPIKLIDIGGEMTETNKVVTKLKAKHGLFDNAKGELELFDGIEVDSNNGMVARLKRATMYQKEGRVVSKEAVTANTPTGSVQASSMVMNTKSRLVAFRGAVAVRMLPGAQGPVGLGRDSRQPVDIRSQELDIDDAQKTAHFRGEVIATQGATTMKTPYLFVKYEGKGTPGLAPAPGATQSTEQGSRVTFLWARNGVDITSDGDRRIISDLADFDATADTALFVGNVQVTQDKNMLVGGRMFVDRKAAKSRVDSPPEGGQPAGRIAALLYQAEAKPGAQTPAKQTAPADPNQMFGSFKSDPNAPIEVESDTLDVLDASKKAVFNGNVFAKQGKMIVRTAELTAFYTGQSGFGLANAADGPQKGGAAQITRVEARRKVLIVSEDGQSATSEWADFDVRSNTALLGGGVVVMRGKDIAEGPRLKIDLTTGMYRFESEGGGPQVQPGPPVAANPPEPNATRSCPPGKQCMLFYPKDAKEKAQELIRKAP